MNLAIIPNKMHPDGSIYLNAPSGKIAVLVNALRLVSNDPDISNRTLLIPDGCEQYGYSEGNHNLGQLLHFLADMLEE